MALHPPDQVVIDLHKHAILQLTVAFSACVKLNLAIEGSDLLHLCADQVSLYVVVSDVELVLLNSATLDTSWQIDRRKV